MRYARQRLAVPISVIPKNPRIAGIDISLGRGHDAQRQPADGQNHIQRPAVCCQLFRTLRASACLRGKLVLFA